MPFRISPFPLLPLPLNLLFGSLRRVYEVSIITVFVTTQVEKVYESNRSQIKA